MPKAENLLKTKGRKVDFSPTKAENMLKGNPLTDNQTDTENGMTNRPTEATPNSRCGRGKVAAWGQRTPKDVKNADRPGYIYEKKDTHDKMTEAKDDIFTQIARILQKSTAFFRYLRAGNEFHHVKMLKLSRRGLLYAIPRTIRRRRRSPTAATASIFPELLSRGIRSELKMSPAPEGRRTRAVCGEEFLRRFRSCRTSVPGLRPIQ